jgi:predicted DNA-binding transcriptional regulator AlpA
MAKAGFRTKSNFYVAQNRAHDPFPKPIRVSPGTVAWVEAEVDAWIARQIAARDSALAAEKGNTPEPTPAADPSTPPRRKRGRPPGSRNKQKPAVPADAKSEGAQS